MRLAIPKAPTDISPPNLTNWLLMNITTIQAHTFIENGEIPIPMIFFIKSPRREYIPRFKWINSLGFENIQNCHIRAKNCDNTVA